MDEPYRNEFHAIKRAFSTHDRALMSSPKFYYEIPSGYPDVTKFLNDDGLCKLDRLVQDAYTQNFLCKTLSKEAFAILSAKYNQDAEEKLNHAIYISQSIQPEVHKNKRLTDQPKYRAWCVLKWCSYPMPNYQSDKIWQDLMSKASVRRDRALVDTELNTRLDRVVKGLTDILQIKGFTA